ncbi:hypothetical protein KQX54_000017 [Cotesia glomerata]|uniref:Uncharacterized protein n=1 Tax=Cotesia glomerata TaxID=32391 RepID=A0AAV7IDP8_COTGL|nr:hypothetical protein KQX54_000017 [Cotesia glomerata]
MSTADDWILVDRYIHYDVVIPRIWLIQFQDDVVDLIDSIRMELLDVIDDGRSIVNLPIIRIGNRVAVLNLRHDIEVWWFRLFGINNITDRRYYILQGYATNSFLNLYDVNAGSDENNLSLPSSPPPPLQRLSPLLSQDVIISMARLFFLVETSTGMARIISRSLRRLRFGEDKEELNSPPPVRRRLTSPPPSSPQAGTSSGFSGLNVP